MKKFYPQTSFRWLEYAELGVTIVYNGMPMQSRKKVLQQLFRDEFGKDVWQEVPTVQAESIG